jgi:hypothetical protein
MVGPMSTSPDMPPVEPRWVHASPVLIVTLILAGALGLACTYAGVMLREAGSGTTTFNFIGLQLTAKQAGVALTCLGIGVCILTFRRVMKTFIGIPHFQRK